MNITNIDAFSHRWTWWTYALFLIALSWLYFGDLAGHGLDAHDDQTFSDNLAIAADPLHFFSLDKAQPSGRPTAELFKFAAFLVGGNDPAFFHLLPIGLHVLASWLLARLVYGLCRERGLALLTGLLFLIGVNHFQAIHHISALDYPLALALALGAALAYLRYINDEAPSQLILALVLIVLSAGAHISGIVLLPVALLWPRRPIPKPWLWMALALLCALPLVALGLTARTTTTWAALDVRLGQDLLTLATDSAGMYLWLVGRLFTTAHWHPVAAASTQAWEFYFGAAALAGLLWLAWQRRELAPWVAWILLGLAPFALITWDVVFLLPSGASRYLYIASAATAFGTAWALVRAGRSARQPLAPYAAALLLAIPSYFALQQAASLSLYSSARSYIARGDSATGIAVLEQLFADPDRAIVPEDEAYFLLCSALPFLGADPGPYLRTARERFPAHIGLHTIAAALEQQARDEGTRQRGDQQMEQLYRQSVASGQDQHFLRNLAAIYHNIGLGHLTRADYPAAETVLLRTLQIHPGRANTQRVLTRAYLQWAEVLEAQNQGEMARAILQRALALDSQPTAAIAPPPAPQ